jgi:23S rRNA (guanosine2251-2'-O)-methyltransferase
MLRADINYQGYRAVSRVEIIYGLHAVGAVLRRQPQQVERVVLARERHDGRMKTLWVLATGAGIPVQILARRDLDKLGPVHRHQGVLAYIRPPVPFTEEDLKSLLVPTENPLLLVLDGIQDPHNLGACLRTADAAGAVAVITPKNRAVGLTPVVHKVACGATAHIPLVQVTNLARTLRLLQDAGIWLIGTAAEAATPLYAADFSVPTALVLGAEEKGLRRLSEQHCDLLVHIPMAGVVESLNVSVAAGICLYEAVRQRSQIASPADLR